MYIEIFLLIIAIIILGYLFFYSADILFAPSTNQNSDNQVCFGSNCFYVTLAKTNAEKERGLMFIEYLDEGNGMFFIFDKDGNHPFWMKNTLIPLDIIWINNDGKVVFISENSQPCKENFCSPIYPNANAKYVLEINAGISKKIGIKIGDKADIKIRR